MADSNVSASLGVGPYDRAKVVAYVDEFTGGATLGSVTVPDGKLWVLQSVATLQGDSTARAVRQYLADDAGTEYASLNPPGTYAAATTLAQNSVVTWEGKRIVPEGWSVKSVVTSQSAGTSKLFVYAIELEVNFNLDAFLALL
jgi:hypothetical protein